MDQMQKPIFLIMLLVWAVPVLAQRTVYQDRVFEENIQSVRLFPSSREFAAQMNTPIVELNSNIPMQLMFDDLAYDPDQYSFKIIHCNFDWTPSDLKDNEFLRDYNEFNILNYEYSINTRIPYIHYNFTLPRVTKSGNYAVVVYRGRDKSKVVLTRRYMVFQNTLQVAASIVPPSQTENRRQVQQINLNINYKARELFDPKNMVKVLIRQNQRWDNVRLLSNATMIREDSKMIEYQLFDGSNVFLGGNEFRFMDLRFVRTRGVNIQAVEMQEDVVYAEGIIHNRRPITAYSQYLDVNGQYAVMNLERQNHELESEYILTTVNLNAEGITAQPYVIGALTQWGQNKDAKMELNKKTNTYQATLLLKQGWYDFQFAYKTPEGWEMNSIEGSYFETENEYEVLIYYRDMGSRYDELIGYANLNPNKRRL
jgi:hypothetical protein